MADLFDLGRNIGGSAAGPGSLNSDPGWLWRGAGRSGEWAAKQFTKAFPDAIAGALQKGIGDGNLSGMLGEAFANAPFAAFKQKILDTFKNLGTEIAKSWDKADEAAFAYGKRIGLAGDQVARLRNEMIKFANTAQIGINYGKSIEEAIKLQGDYSAAVGRNIMMTNKQAESIMALSAVVGDDMAVKFSTSLDKFGLSTETAGEMMTQMFNKSVKQGISLETYAKNVTDHLTMAQKYTFKNGINGLTSMAEKAAKLRIDMDMVAQMADKMSTIEDSVNVSSQLQVLGGPFTQFADPMKLLYGSLNDMEGLMDQLTNMTKSLGRFNRETGEIEIATFDKLRLKQAAQTMGIDYGKLIEQTTVQARRGEVEYQMRGLSNIPREYQELLKNTATFQNGIAGVRGKDGEFKALSKLNGDDLRLLADNSKTDSENIAEIAQMLRGALTVKEGEEKQKENLRAQKYAQQAESIKNVYDMIGHNAEALNKLINIQMGSMVWQSFGSPIMSKAGGLAKGAVKMLMSVKEKGGIIRTHDDGGYISDGIPGKEMILNSAQHGEFVVNKASTMQYLPLLNMINADKSGNGGVLDFMFNTEEYLKKNKEDVTRLIKDRMNSQRRDMRSIEREMKKLDINSKQYSDLLERKKKLQGKWSKNMKLAYDNSAYDMKSLKIAKGMKIGTTIGSGLLSGGIAAYSSWQESKASGENIMDRNRAKGKAWGAGIGGAIGGAIGTFLGGPAGTIIGASIGNAAGKALGDVIGQGNKTRRNRKRNEFVDEITNDIGKGKFIGLKGDYSTGELREIKNSLMDGDINSGELSEELREKMLRNGNDKIFTKGVYKNGGLLSGNSHSNGGIKLFNEVEGGEFIINKESAARSLRALTRINDGTLNDSNIKVVEPMGKQMKVNGSTETSLNSGNKEIVIKPININLNGSIKLENDGQTIDIMKELKDNPMFLSKLADMITKQININNNMGFDKKSYTQKYTNW